MPRIEDLVQQMRKNPKDIPFKDLCGICDFYFGKPRRSSTSHRIYKTPWPADPRVNIQNEKGMAKAYQVKQVLRAIELMEFSRDTDE